MLTYCKMHRHEVRYVIAQELSRFARNNLDQAQTIFDLGSIGIKVRSVYEGNIDETAVGKLNANIVGTFNQYFSDSLSEKQRAKQRLAITAGRYPWRAPIGYHNISANSGPNIEPDKVRGPLIRRVFELIESELYKKFEVLRIITQEGLTTLGGKPVSKQTFDHVIKNPLYAGWIRRDGCEGLHDAFLDMLRSLRPSADALSLFPKIAAKLWAKVSVKQQSDSEKEAKELKTQLEQHKMKKKELLSMRLRGELSLEEFEVENAEFRLTICEIEAKMNEKLQIAVSSRATAASFARFAELQLLDIANA